MRDGTTRETRISDKRRVAWGSGAGEVGIGEQVIVPGTLVFRSVNVTQYQYMIFSKYGLHSITTWRGEQAKQGAAYMPYIDILIT